MYGVVLVDKTGYRDKLVAELNEVYPRYAGHRWASIIEWLEGG